MNKFYLYFKIQNFSKFFKSRFFYEKILEGKFKNQLLEPLCNLVLSVCLKFEGCPAKTVGVGFLRVTGFSKKKHYCKILPHGCEFDGTDSKLVENV